MRTDKGTRMGRDRLMLAGPLLLFLRCAAAAELTALPEYLRPTRLAGLWPSTGCLAVRSIRAPRPRTSTSDRVKTPNNMQD